MTAVSLPWDLSGSRRLGQPFRVRLAPQSSLVRRVGSEPGRFGLRSLARAKPRHPPAFRHPRTDRSRASWTASVTWTGSPSVPDGRLVARSRQPARPSSGTRRAGDPGIKHEGYVGEQSRSARTATRWRRAGWRSSGSLRHQDREADGRFFLGSWKHPGGRFQPGRKAPRLGQPERHYEHLGRCETATRRRAGRRRSPHMRFGSRRTGSSSRSATAPEKSSSGRRRVEHAEHAGQPLVGHGGGVTSLDFDPDGTRLVTASDDGNLRLWDVATRTLIGAPLPGSTVGGSAHFFPDGKHVLGVFQSGAAVLWNVDPTAWAAKACSIARRNLDSHRVDSVLGRRRLPRGLSMTRRVVRPAQLGPTKIRRLLGHP